MEKNKVSKPAETCSGGGGEEKLEELKVKGQKAWKSTAGFLVKASDVAGKFWQKTKKSKGYQNVTGKVGEYAGKVGDKLEEKLPENVTEKASGVLGKASGIFGKARNLVSKGAKKARGFLKKEAGKK